MGGGFQTAADGTRQTLIEQESGGTWTPVASPNDGTATTDNSLTAIAGTQATGLWAVGWRVVAATTGTFYGQAMTAGDIYTVVGSGQVGYGGDGGLATKAKLDSPQDVTFDGSGNMVIADGAITTGSGLSRRGPPPSTGRR